MPYADERAGLAALQAIADSEDFAEFRARLQPPSQQAVLPFPPFRPSPSGKARTHLVAIDGSQVYDRFPGRLPDTHVGVRIPGHSGYQTEQTVVFGEAARKRFSQPH